MIQKDISQILKSLGLSFVANIYRFHITIAPEITTLIIPALRAILPASFLSSTVDIKLGCEASNWTQELCSSVTLNYLIA
jgi:hypothetical protein